jgi:hypothetical protein
VPWLKQLATGLLPQKPGFMPTSVHVGIVVDKVALGEAFVLVLWVFSVYIIPPWLFILIYHLEDEQVG